jgi:hypothetical protein
MLFFEARFFIVWSICVKVHPIIYHAIDPALGGYMPIQAIYCNPAMCVARVGGSRVPMDAFTWVPSQDPHNIGETRIAPRWSLDVQPNGSVVPRMPDRITLRDESGIRPVAPFLELWCDVGVEDNPSSWQRQPLTTRILAADGLNTANLTFEVVAMNFKVARRMVNANFRFGTFEPVQLRGDDHTARVLRGVNPAIDGAQPPMIPAGRFIPLGRVQIIRPGIQPAPGSTPWAGEVNLETIRLRYTPGPGALYGPTSLANVPIVSHNGEQFTAVPAENAFLNPAAGWFGAVPQGPVVPGDTYDGAERQDARSLGVIDDTCEVRVVARLDRRPIGRSLLECHGNIFAGPPDYAPDRRPFVSLADDLNDRAGDKERRSREMSDAALDRWVEDLFERAYETVSLFNVDIWRDRRASTLAGTALRPQPIVGDTYPQATRAMGARDALRDGNIGLEAPSDNVHLPLSERAKERHRNLADIVALKRFVRENPNRLQALVRRPFFVAANENPGVTTMQMPPFMRQSNAEPLTLTAWQYDLLMEWQRRVLAGPTTIAIAAEIPAPPLDTAATRRRTEVLGRMRSAGVDG